MLNDNPNPSNRWLWLTFKFAASIGLLFWLATKISYMDVARLLLQADVPKLIEAFIMLGVSLALSGLRWHFSSSRRIKLPTAIRYTWISQFYGIFLPGVASADIAKGLAMTANRDSPCATTLIASILLERFAGLCCVVIFGLFAYSLQPHWFHISQTLSAVAALFGFVLLFCFPILLRLILILFPHSYLLDIPREISRCLDWKLWGSILIISFAIVASNVMFYWTVYLAAGGSANWIQMAIYNSLDSLATVLPVAVAGIGVRDSLAVALFTGSGDGTREVAFAWMVFFLMLLHGLVGFLLQWRQLFKKQSHDSRLINQQNTKFDNTNYKGVSKPLAPKS